MAAPRAKATIFGDDDVSILEPSLVQLGRLALDFGEGDDDFFDGGWVPPAGSVITGLP